MLQRALRQLESDIRASELRVLDIDHRAAVSLHALRTNASQAIAVKLLAAAGLVAAGWLLHRPQRRRGLHEPRVPRSRFSAGLQGAQRWAPILLPLAAPLLDRKVALLLAGLGLPIVARKLAPLRTVPTLDLAAFSGLWFEVARLPQRNDANGRHDASLHYGLDDKGFDVTQRWIDEQGQLREKSGRGRTPDATRPGEIEVSFAPAWLRWWPGSWDDHWVLYVDRDYSCALIGNPERDALRLVAREPAMPEEAVQALFALADKLGFDSARMRRTPHS
jgi:apolipoprotein D and lipocalin family protein